MNLCYDKFVKRRCMGKVQQDEISCIAGGQRKVGLRRVLLSGKI